MLEVLRRSSVVLFRASSIAAFAFGFCAFVCYPRPWCSHWSPEKRIAVFASDLSGVAAMASLTVFLVVLFLYGMFELPIPRVRRCFYLNLATIFLNALIPRT